VGRSVSFASLPHKPAGSGVAQASITVGDMRKMSAELYRLDPGAKMETTVPEGCDAYVFMLTGAGRIAANGTDAELARESFAAVGETQRFALTNKSAEAAEIVYVLAPPPGSPREHAGLPVPSTVITRAAAPTAYIADQKKNRRYFVAKEAVHSDRGHAMIVEYEDGTETVMHYHPDAESMFVVLTGRIRFVIDGEPVVLARGEAACFPVNDRHALRCAEGTTSASFLEFHIPGAFTTVKV
jgi:quercetin dioxygenase-like cupin family protein